MSKRKKQWNLPSLKTRQQLWARCLFLFRKGWMALAIIVIVLALLFSLFRALTPWAKQYKSEVEAHLSTLLGQPVQIKSMETSWYWLEPVLKLNQVTVLENAGHTLQLDQLMVGINLLSSLWHWQLQPGILYVDDVHLSLRQLDDRWQIDGLRQGEAATILDLKAYAPVIAWLLTQQKIVLKNISAMIHLKDGSVLPLEELNITAMNHRGHYRLKAEASFAEPVDTEILILAELSVDANDLSKLSGHAYASVHQFSPAQWQVLFPVSEYQFKEGIGDFEWWADVSKGQLADAQLKLDFQQLVWQKGQFGLGQRIQSLTANLAWQAKQDGKGWQLSGDQIDLRDQAMSWPENAFSLRYQAATQHYDFFVKHLLIEPLLALPIEWPSSMQPLLAAHLQGELQDTQIGLKNNQPDYFLSKFIDLSWQTQSLIPAVNHVSGVLNWQPQEGRLEFDGENTAVKFPGFAPLSFTEVNAAFEWQTLSDGLRVSMERLIFMHPQLVLSARGAMDDPFSPSSSKLRLTAEFSAEQAEHWLAYIPSSSLKPELNDWLKHDIKHIDKASGQLSFNGALADFPFDNTPGEFSLTGLFSGVDLWFHRQWPAVNDLDLFMQVNKRNMDINVLHASLREIDVTQANLNVHDIGLGKETLLLHGKAQFPAPQLKHYVLATPLRKHFGQLKKLNVTGPIDLDLNVEVPLYPENDDILVRGDIALADNQAIFHHAINDIRFTHLTGTLAFDEKGVLDSDLKARLGGNPVAVQIQSVRNKNPYTEIKIAGDTTIDLLKEKLNLPALSFMDGPLTVVSKIVLTDDPSDLDNMTISSSLQGVSIDLPKPLGKMATVVAPLVMNVGFNPDKGVRLRFNYNNRLSSDIWFGGSKQAFVLTKGVMLVGSGQAQMKNETGLQLTGFLPTFDVREWQAVWANMPDVSSNRSLSHSLQSIDMTFGQISLWNKTYPKVALKANKLAVGDWSILIQQQDLSADVRYQIADNRLSGHVGHLYLAKPNLSKATNNTDTIHFKPMDIPQLDLNIDELKLGDVELGKMALKSTSTLGLWHIDECNIQSPYYVLNINSDWAVKEGKSNTSLQAHLQIKHLEKSLANWHITPVVEANKGLVTLNGSWEGSIYDYRLEKLNGVLQMSFESGQITHLGPEVEEKLGLGKLLSILSLQTLPRRLKLDFSDLSNQGYSFDIFKGDFNLKNGVLSTSNSYIDGPVAYASMKGELDVIKQLYDIDLHVSPHVTASLPVVATIAGGPLAGVAAWVASKIINQGMQQVTGYTYKVSGPWLNPVVQQLNIFKKDSRASGTSS